MCLCLIFFFLSFLIFLSIFLYSFFTSLLKILIVPLKFLFNPNMHLKRVVFPAPLGPIIPKKSPFFILNETLSKIMSEPFFKFKLFILTISPSSSSPLSLYRIYIILYSNYNYYLLYFTKFFFFLIILYLSFIYIIFI